MYYKGFSVLKTRDIKETGEFIVRIYNKINKCESGILDINNILNGPVCHSGFKRLN